ncbi:MAG: bifunctional diaminohydroxyphosphoribosylaminopyrimidine deaminase/5-amino-6-(5-phosphoribosylamino)uracil reductase RibD [Betaproteobacteria bacterium]|nr:bifunctional diaminohydroxyphosphoribosylaminopyrimidine deaminase/5-amino-6-(5-phosphoribosylamino)uracil reductase RibD [Betaproteobacteria bacterium]
MLNSLSASPIDDHHYMTLALRLAEHGLYTTHPNPRVGCVIVKNHQVVGQGAHLRAGDLHAEAHALRQAGSHAEGSDIYVSLEPCSHYGRTPPCVEAVIAAKPKRVIIAMQDPNPLVAGRGIAALREHGVEVVLGVMEKEALALNVGFVARMKRGLPYVRCKVAASLDGRTALSNGKSQWITSEAARSDVQHWRAQSSAILTGIGTLLADDPSMIVRLDGVVRQPLRVIVDAKLKTPLQCKMLEPSMLEQSPVFIAYAQDESQQASLLEAAGAQLMQLPDAKQQVDLEALLRLLAQRGVNDVLVEAGQAINGALLRAGLIDEFIFYYAPKLMGSDAKSMFLIDELTDMQQAIDLQVLDVRSIGCDIRLRARIATDRD